LQTKFRTDVLAFVEAAEQLGNPFNSGTELVALHSVGYSFRPTGSTTAALIFILHTVARLLTTHPYVVVIAIDFSKAFDNVRHSTLLNKMADLDIPDDVYNWLVSYISGHSHCWGVVRSPRNFDWDYPGVQHRPGLLRR